eukprot:15364599-Ditylum_brightwellii.AAC.10
MQNKICSKQGENEKAVVALWGLSWSGAMTAKINQIIELENKLQGAKGLQMQITEESLYGNYTTTTISNDDKAGQKGGSMIIKLSPSMFLCAAWEEKKQEREMRTETGNLSNCNAKWDSRRETTGQKGYCYIVNKAYFSDISTETKNECYEEIQ